jgi:hypothetical protein
MDARCPHTSGSPKSSSKRKAQEHVAETRIPCPKVMFLMLSIPCEYGTHGHALRYLDPSIDVRSHVPCGFYTLRGLRVKPTEATS